MERIRPPFIGMGGVVLGFGLSQLAQQLLDESIKLVSIDPNDSTLKKEDGDRVWTASVSGSERMPTIRARLHRYATLAVAKLYPDLEMPPADNSGDGTGGRFYSIPNLLYQAKKKLTPVLIARDIIILCQGLVKMGDDDRNEIVGKRIELVLHQLDMALETHSHLCSALWVPLADKARKLSERDD